MTYLYFTLLYLGLPVLVLGLTLPRSFGGLSEKRVGKELVLAMICMAAYAAVLNNYLAYQGVRGYEQDRVLQRLLFIPLDEYLLLGAAALLAGFLLVHVLARTSRSPRAPGTAVRRTYIGGTLIYVAMIIAGAGLLLFGPDRVLYLAVLLAWAGPVLLLLWLYGGRHFLGEWRRAILISAGVAAIYLWIAAWVGLSQYLWIISSRYTLLFGLSRLPLEEALFYLFFVLMVSKAIMVLISRDQQTAPVGE